MPDVSSSVSIKSGGIPAVVIFVSVVEGRLAAVVYVERVMGDRGSCCNGIGSVAPERRRTCGVEIPCGEGISADVHIEVLTSGV